MGPTCLKCGLKSILSHSLVNLTSVAVHGAIHSTATQELTNQSLSGLLDNADFFSVKVNSILHNIFAELRN